MKVLAFYRDNKDVIKSRILGGQFTLDDAHQMINPIENRFALFSDEGCWFGDVNKTINRVDTELIRYSIVHNFEGVSFFKAFNIEVPDIIAMNMPLNLMLALVKFEVGHKIIEGIPFDIIENVRKAEYGNSSEKWFERFNIYLPNGAIARIYTNVKGTVEGNLLGSVKWYVEFWDYYEDKIKAIATPWMFRSIKY